MKELAHEQELAHSNLAGVGVGGWGGVGGVGKVEMQTRHASAGRPACAGRADQVDPWDGPAGGLDKSNFSKFITGFTRSR